MMQKFIVKFLTVVFICLCGFVHDSWCATNKDAGGFSQSDYHENYKEPDCMAIFMYTTEVEDTSYNGHKVVGPMHDYTRVVGFENGGQPYTLACFSDNLNLAELRFRNGKSTAQQNNRYSNDTINLYKARRCKDGTYIYIRAEKDYHANPIEGGQNKAYKCDYSANGGKGGWTEVSIQNLPRCTDADNSSLNRSVVNTIKNDNGSTDIYGLWITNYESNQSAYKSYRQACRITKLKQVEYTGVVLGGPQKRPVDMVQISPQSGGGVNQCFTDQTGAFKCLFTSNKVNVTPPVNFGYKDKAGVELQKNQRNEIVLDCPCENAGGTLTDTGGCTCPNGGTFNPTTERCDERELTPCEKAGGTPDANGGCTCPNGGTFNTGTGQCDAPVKSQDQQDCESGGGTWNESTNSCNCGTKRWDAGTTQCLFICNYLLKAEHQSEASPERLACCRAGSATRWTGGDKEGTCTCVDANKNVDETKKWEGGQCVANVPNDKTPEEKCRDLGDIVIWDATNSLCLCVDANKNVDNTKRLDGDKCVPVEAEPEKTPEQSCIELGDFVRWTGTECVCADETKVLNNGQCVDKESSAPVVPVRTPQDACNDLGDSVAVWQNNQCICKDEVSDFVYNEESKTGQCVVNTEKEKAKALKDKKQAYDDAKAKEQSLANRTLTAATTAATGLGMMNLMMGKAEQKADAAAEQDMAAYMATMRCTYAGGKSVKAGPDEIELPGGNDGKLMSYRSEYISLAKSLKERKAAMDMLPGIESEEILDKAEMGLYDDENKGIEGGAYASLYRAKQGSEEDQKKIDADKEKSAKRVKYGATALAAGAAVGVVGNSLINGKLGEKLKEARKDRKEKKNKSPNVKEDDRPVIKHAPDPENMKSESVDMLDNTSEQTGSVAGVLGVITGSTGAGSSNPTQEHVGNVNGTSPTVESQRISFDEPDVDGTKWSESQYLQCFAHFFPKDRYSSNLRSYWAKSHNSQYCSGYTGGKYIYDFKKNPNPCPQQKFKSLNAGEWEIQVRNGNKAVKGIAVCNNMAGNKEDELRDNVDAHTDNGKHCWCKITQTDLTDCLVTQKFSWEYRGEYGPVDAEDVEWFNDNKTSSYVDLYPAGYYQEGQNSCLWECADACAYNLLDYGRHRQRQMHGVPQIVNFVEKYNNM